MTRNILLVGVGGQGAILFSKILVAGLAEVGYDVKMSEIHGMSQRGGTVTTQVKYGEKIYAPNINEGEADIIIAFEKLEGLRALPFLKKGGTVIFDEYEIAPQPVLTGAAEYPHDAVGAMEGKNVKFMVIKAYETAKKLGNVRAQNIVLLGALTRTLDLEGIDWKDLIRRHVPARAVDLNMEAFEAGRSM